MQYKEIIIGVVIALLVVVGFAFWERIFRPALNSPQGSQDAESTTMPLAEQSGNQAATSSPDNAQNKSNALVPTGTPQNRSVPVYRGRPLDEARFSQNVLQSMNAQRKDQLSLDIRKYAKMVKDNPEYIAAWLQVALLKKAIEDYEGSRDIWLYVTVARPAEATSFLNLGDLYTNYLKDYPKAEQNYQNAIKVEPKNAMGYLGLSDLYAFFYKEKAAQAEAVLKQGIAANPNDANLQKALVRLYERNAK